MWFVRLGLLLLVSPVAAKWTRGSVAMPESQFVFVDKFCFDKSGGTIDIQGLKNDPAKPGQQLLYYHDVEGSFDAVYNSGLSCQAKVDLASRSDSLDTLEEHPLTVHVANIIPRFWYLVVADCTELPVQNISVPSFQVHWTNTEPGGPSEFGKDEMGIFETLVVCLVAFVVLFGLFIVAIVRFWKDKSTSAQKVMALLMAMVSLEFLSVAFQVVHYNAYAQDGIGHPQVQDLVRFIDIFPKMGLFGLFIFIAKGWQIYTPQQHLNRQADSSSDGPTRKERVRDVQTTVEVLCLYLLASFSLFWWSYRADDHVKILSLWQSPPGVILVVLRLLTLCWFLRSIHVTWRLEQMRDKKSFYMLFAVLGSLWFLSLPVVVLVAEVLAPFERKKTVEILYLLFNVISYYAFFFLFGCNKQHLTQLDGQPLAQEDEDDEEEGQHMDNLTGLAGAGDDSD